MKPRSFPAICLGALLLLMLTAVAPVLAATRVVPGGAGRAAPAGDWTVQTSGTTGFLSAVSCVNAAAAWAGGQNGTILRTTNGGVTWSRLASSPMPADEEVTDVQFVNPTYGWAIGGANAIMKSTNGGTSWSGQSFLGFAYPPNLLTLSAVDTAHAWIGGYDTNGGFTYDAFYSIVLGTGTGGASWWSSASVAAGDFGHGIMGIDFVDASHGWAVTVDGSFIVTTNGGANWTVPLTPSGVGSLDDVSFADTANGWAVGQDSLFAGLVMHTSDGGQTWFRQAQSAIAAGPVTQVVAVCAVSPHVAWAVCRGGFVLHTADAGASWTVEQPTALDLKDVSFADADTGWVVGDGGTILRHGPALPVDNVAPVTRALAAVTVKRGHTATLKYRILDAVPAGGTAVVTIKIKNKAGKVKKTLALGSQPAGKTCVARFKASLSKGVYKWYVYATDAAGNAQSAVGWKKLTVK